MVFEGTCDEKDTGDVDDGEHVFSCCEVTLLRFNYFYSTVVEFVDFYL